MGKGAKTLILLLLIGSVVGIFTLQTQNQELFQGQIELADNDQADDPLDIALPDITSELKIDPPEEGNEDIIVTATIKNIGQGRVDSEESFKYTILVNGIDVLTNTDTFTSIEPGDSFSFTYPVPRKIYLYEDSGTVTFVVDSDNELNESDETNNEISQDFDFS